MANGAMRPRLVALRGGAGGVDGMFDFSLDPALQECWLRAKVAAAVFPGYVDLRALAELRRAGGDAIEKRLPVDVVAEVRGRDDRVPGLAETFRVALPGAGRGAIVAGRVAVAELLAVHAHESVVRLKATTASRPLLTRSAARARGALRPGGRGRRGSAAATRPTGRGVIVGVVDFGFDLAHPNFRDAGGRTRVLRFRDLGADLELRRDQIDRSLAAPDFADVRGADGARRPDERRLLMPDGTTRVYDMGRRGHGTHVADIAAGNGRATAAPGMAPEAGLVLVQLPRTSLETPDMLANSRFVLEAVRYVFAVADELGRPAVVNLSLGAQAGRHDDEDLVQLALDAMLVERPGRSIVLAAGNARLAATHASAVVPGGGAREIRWRLRPGDASRNSLELYYRLPERHADPTAAPIEVRLTAPDGVSLGPIALGGAYAIYGVPDGIPPRRLASVKAASESGDLPLLGVACHRTLRRKDGRRREWGQVLMVLDGTRPAAAAGFAAPPGTWTVRVTDRRPSGDADDTAVHAWLEHDIRHELSTDGGAATDPARPRARPPALQSYFEEPDPDSTISGFACGRLTIAVGASATGGGPAPFSAAGPTRAGGRKPDVCAPGTGIRAALAGTRVARTRSGTSMAAPHVTGAVALLLEAATAAKVDFTAAEIRDLVIAGAAGARRGRWDRRRGHGEIDAAASLAALRARIAARRRPR
jgi:subtilisin family serine protease